MVNCGKVESVLGSTSSSGIRVNSQIYWRQTRILYREDKFALMARSAQITKSKLSKK